MILPSINPQQELAEHYLRIARAANEEARTRIAKARETVYVRDEFHRMKSERPLGSTSGIDRKYFWTGERSKISFRRPKPRTVFDTAMKG